MNWKDALQRPAGTQMQHLRSLLESRPMLIRIPDEWLIVNDPLSTVDRIQACRGSDGSCLFVYTSSGKPVRVRMRDKIHDKLTGKVARAWWYDPRKGTSALIGDFPRQNPVTGPPTSAAWISRVSSRRPPAARERLGAVVDDASKNYPAPGSWRSRPPKPRSPAVTAGPSGGR